MTRKAKGKFRLPGIQGRGFKMTGSAPFKVKSSLKQDENDETDVNNEENTPSTELEFSSSIGEADQDAYLEAIQGSAKKEGQSGSDYFMQELSKLIARKRAGKNETTEDEYEDIEPTEHEKDPYRDKNKYPENFDQHGNYKGDLPEIYPDFNPGADDEEEDVETKDEVVEEETSYYTPSEKTLTEETTTSEPKVSYEGTTKSEMYDLRRPFREDGTWDPNNNPEHAAIQNRINELHGADKRYDAGPVDNTELLSEMIEDGNRIYPHDSKWNALNPEEKQKYVDAINEELGPNAQYESVEDYQNWRDQS